MPDPADPLTATDVFSQSATESSTCYLTFDAPERLDLAFVAGQVLQVGPYLVGEAADPLLTGHPYIRY